MIEKREDKIILEITKEWLQNSNNSQTEFAVKMLAPNIEEQEPESANDYSRWKGNLQKKVNRIMTGENPFPLAWKWAWVESLPDTYRKECRRKLAAAAGYMDALPELGESETVLANTAKIHEAFAKVILVSTSAHDGVYDERDSIDDANKQIDALCVLVEVSQEEIKRVHTGTGATGTLLDVNTIK